MGGLFRWKDGRDVPDVMTTIYEYPKFRATLRVTLNSGTEEVTQFMGDRGVLTIRDGVLNLSPQSGSDDGPCTPGWPKQMRSDYSDRWYADHKILPGTQTAPVESASWYTPPGYNDDREHLWNYFQSVRTRQPSVEDAHFGNNTAIGCHMANYSYFNKTLAQWDADTRRIKG